MKVKKSRLQDRREGVLSSSAVSYDGSWGRDWQRRRHNAHQTLWWVEKRKHITGSDAAEATSIGPPHFVGASLCPSGWITDGG